MLSKFTHSNSGNISAIPLA